MLERKDIIASLIGATQEVFEMMFFKDVYPADLLDEETRISDIDISATVFFGGKMSGAVALRCNKKFALELTSHLNMGTPEKIDDTVRDAVGEIVNMIVGGMKTRLSKSKGMFEISLPNIITGDSQTVYQKGYKEEFPRVIIPFLHDDDTIYLDLVCNERT